MFPKLHANQWRSHGASPPWVTDASEVEDLLQCCAGTSLLRPALHLLVHYIY